MSTGFLDTSGWFAALSPKEAKHRATDAMYRSWIESDTRLVTTNLVVAERVGADATDARGRPASRTARLLIGPRTGARGTNTQPTWGTGLPPMSRSSSNNQG